MNLSDFKGWIISFANQVGLDIKALRADKLDADQVVTQIDTLLGNSDWQTQKTVEQVQDIVAAMLQNGNHTNISVSYDDAGDGSISLTASGTGSGTGPTDEEIEDLVAGFLQPGTGINATYDDANNILTVSLSGEIYTTAEKNKVANVPNDTNSALAGKSDISHQHSADDVTETSEKVWVSPEEKSQISDHESRIAALEAGGVGAGAIDERYNNITALIADQNNQIDAGLYRVSDASDDPTVNSGRAYYEYLGTLNGTLADYYKFSEEESMDLDAQFQALQDQIDDHEARIVALENASPGGGNYTPPADYADVATMLADQGNQVENEEYTVTDASGWSTITHTNWATFKKKATSTASESDYELREQFDVDSINSGNSNISAGAFTGELNVSGGNRYYDDYTSGAVVNLSLSTTKSLGSTATVRIKGDLTGTVPATWNFSGQAISTDNLKLNEITLLYVSESDVRIINRVFDYQGEYDDPLTLTNLNVWYDGTENSLMTFDSGGIETWADKKSGVVISRVNQRPTFDSDKVIYTTNSQLVSLANPLLDYDQDFHGFLIFRMTFDTTETFVTNTVSTSPNKRFGIGRLDGENLSVKLSNGSRKSIAFSDTESFHVVEFKCISGVITAFLDGIEMTGNADANTGTQVNFTLGGSSPVSGGAFEFKDFFVNAGEMTTAERDSMLNYIAQKHGL